MVGSKTFCASSSTGVGSTVLISLCAMAILAGPVVVVTPRPSMARSSERMSGARRSATCCSTADLSVNRDALAYGLLDPGVVSSALLGDAGEIGGGVVSDFLAQVAREILAPTLDRMRSAHVRARRHRQHIRRFGDKDPRRGRSRPSGRDVSDGWNRAVQQILDHLAHRAIQAAGGVDDQHKQGRALLGGSADHAVDVRGNHRIDDPIEVSDDDDRGTLLRDRRGRSHDIKRR
jgi:hypothetical protein